MKRSLYNSTSGRNEVGTRNVRDPETSGNTAPAAYRCLAGKIGMGITAGFISCILWVSCSISIRNESIYFYFRMLWGVIPTMLLSGYAAYLRWRSDTPSAVQTFLAVGFPAMALLSLIPEVCGISVEPCLTLEMILQLPCLALAIIPKDAADFAYQIAVSLSLSEKAARTIYVLAGLLISFPWSCLLIRLVQRGGALIAFMKEDLRKWAETEPDMDDLIESWISDVVEQLRRAVHILFGRNEADADADGTASALEDTRLPDPSAEQSPPEGRDDMPEE